MHFAASVELQNRKISHNTCRPQDLRPIEHAGFRHKMNPTIKLPVFLSICRVFHYSRYRSTTGGQTRLRKYAGLRAL